MSNFLPKSSFFFKFVSEFVKCMKKTLKINAVRPKGSQRDANGSKGASWSPRPVDRRTLFGAIIGPIMRKNAKKSQREPEWSQKSGKRTCQKRCKNRCRKSIENDAKEMDK
jgi:hypothetical protein